MVKQLLLLKFLKFLVVYLEVNLYKNIELIECNMNLKKLSNKFRIVLILFKDPMIYKLLLNKLKFY